MGRKSKFQRKAPKVITLPNTEIQEYGTISQHLEDYSVFEKIVPIEISTINSPIICMAIQIGLLNMEGTIIENIEPIKSIQSR